MDDEFKLCWKNFQDNIASGFQNLYDRGDLVDVTLACDGKLLQAHKFVLAICSPYFQEIFITNPCKHPTIFLKDVSFNIMCELLEFMYQGVVNVKHTELQSFMKVGQQLQIKGLASNSQVSPGSTESDKSPSQVQQSEEGNNANEGGASNNNCTIKNENPKSDSTSKSTDGKNTPITPPLPIINSPAISLFKNTGNTSTPQLHHGTKRHIEFPSDALPPYARKQFRRVHHHPLHNSSSEANESGENQLDQNDDIFLPHFAMFEGRYEGKRENNEHHNSASTSAPTIRNPFGPAFNFDYSVYKNNAPPTNSSEYPNELYMASDFSKNFGNHMEIPPIAPGEHWFQGKLEFMLSQRGKPLLVHDGHTFGIQYVRKDKKYWQCNLSRKFNCKARVTTTDTGEIIVTNNEHCHTEIRQHLRKDYQRQKVMMNAIMNLSNNTRIKEESYRQVATNFNNLRDLHSLVQQSHHFGSLQQQQQQQNNLDASSETHGSDMEDLSMKRFQIDQGSSSSLNNDKSEDQPIDCGILSSSRNVSPMSTIDVLRKYLPNSALNNSSFRNLNNSSANNNNSNTSINSTNNSSSENNIISNNNNNNNNNNYLDNPDWKSKEENL